MTKIILHGGFTRDWNELNRSFYAEISKDVLENGNILLNYFARENEEAESLFERDKVRILEQAGGKPLHVVLARHDSFTEQLRRANALFLQGGDTPKLLEALKSYVGFKRALEGKTVAGSSAGAQVLATYYHSSTYGGIHEGLGVLPIRLIPHFGSKRFERKDNPMELMAHHPKNLELVVLKDYEWKVFYR